MEDKEFQNFLRKFTSFINFKDLGFYNGKEILKFSPLRSII